MTRIHYGVAKVYTWDYEGQVITIELSLLPGLPRLEFATRVGTGFGTVRDRLKAAFRSSGLKWPTCHIVCDIRNAEKITGRQYDLPIALAILMASGQIPEQKLLAKGELNLDGTLFLEEELPLRIKQIDLPVYAPLAAKNVLTLASLEAYLQCLTLEDEERSNFHEVERSLLEQQRLERPKQVIKPWDELTIDQLHGQELAHRALQLAFVGKHDLFLEGSPGCGKSAIIWAYISLFEEHPWRSPQPSITLRQFMGGGPRNVIGEVTRCHEGILFLDEIYFFSKHVLNHLLGLLDHRQVVEKSKERERVLPADFLLLASGNPCPCGRLFETDPPCRCKPYEILRYQQKLKGSLRDRFTLYVPMRSLPSRELPKILAKQDALDPQMIRQKIEVARDIQRARALNLGLAIPWNGRMPKQYLGREEVIPKEIARQAATLAKHYHLSARAYLNLLRLCRTIADYEESKQVRASHLYEAMLYLPQPSEESVA